MLTIFQSIDDLTLLELKVEIYALQTKTLVSFQKGKLIIGHYSDFCLQKWAILPSVPLDGSEG